MKKIIVVGSSNTDMVVKSDHIPAHGETVLGGKFLMTSGGKGANQAVAIAKLGAHVVFVAKVGDDLFGREAIKTYNLVGIDTRYIFHDMQERSGVALIMVDRNAENCISVASGANNTLSIADIDVVRAEIESADIVLMQMEIPMNVVEYVAQLAHAKGVKVILNPAPAAQLSSGLLKQLYMITPNKTEAEILSGVKVTDWESAKVAADAIAGQGVSNVVVTLGSLGALARFDGEHHCIDAHKVKAIDTTAAGDVFNGALCVALSEGRNIVQAVEFAGKASSIAVTRMGAQSSIPTLEEVLAV